MRPPARPSLPRPWLILPALGLVQLAVGWFLPPSGPQPRAYPPLIARGGVATVCPVHAGFGDDAVFPDTRADTAPPGVARFGSWLPGVGDAGTGRLETPWFDPGEFFEVLVAGYPGKPGNDVLLQLRRAATDGTAEVPEREVRLRLPDARERWVQHRVTPPPLPGEEAGAWRARLVAVDGNRGPGGWVGISAPFREGRHTLAWSLDTLGRLALTLAAAVAALLGPGVALRAWRRPVGWDERAFSLALLPLPGAAWLVGVALVCWRLAPGVSPGHVAAVGLAPVFTFCLVAGWRAASGGGGWFSPAEGRVLALAGLLLLVAVGKAQFSGGPDGELYGGTVSRTLEVGTRSDSRIAFHVVQLVAHGTSPFSAPGHGYFAPWSFTSRGPLLALASAPLVLSAGARVPTAMPDQPWLPFDPEGFAVYRLAMMVLAAAALLPLFAAAGALLGAGDVRRADRWGLFTAALAALTPFVVHEVYFTWGKLPTAGVLAAAVCGLAAGRFVAAGGLVGLAYLCHPLALLYAPFLGLGAGWLAFAGGPRGGKPAAGGRERWGWAVAAGLRFSVPVLLALGFWRAVGRGEPAQDHGQEFFLSYLFQPSSRAAFDPGVWARHRRDSLLNTLVPGWLLLVNPWYNEMNALDHRSPLVVRWFLQSWNALPFGLGVLGLPALGRGCWRGARRRPGVFALAVAGPFALFAVYWGASPTGLMREGLHPWVFALLGFAAAAGADRPWPGAGKAGSWLLAGRGLEVLAMCWLPTWLTSPLRPRPAFLWVDAAMLSLSLAAFTALTVLCYRIYRGTEATDGPFPNPSAHTVPTAASNSPAAAAPASVAANASTDPPSARPSGR